MFVSTETHAPFSRVSRYQTGQLPKNNTDGSSTLTPDKPGPTLCTISTQNGLLCNSQENVKNQMFFNGSDLNNGVVVSPQDFSTMKSHSQPDGDTAATCSMIKTTNVSVTEFSTHSLTVIKNNQLSSVLTQPLLRDVNTSRENGTIFANSLLKS
jgi:hypothetical protein